MPCLVYLFCLGDMIIFPLLDDLLCTRLIKPVLAIPAEHFSEVPKEAVTVLTSSSLPSFEPEVGIWFLFEGVVATTVGRQRHVMKCIICCEFNIKIAVPATEFTHEPSFAMFREGIRFIFSIDVHQPLPSIAVYLRCHCVDARGCRKNNSRCRQMQFLEKLRIFNLERGEVTTVPKWVD